MTFWKSLSFKALQKEWYKRLEEQGFKDAERLVGDEMELRQGATHPYKGKAELERAIREHYYRVLSQNIQEAQFRNEVDRVILVLYADGKNIKTICAELEKRGDKRCRNTVTFTIRKYEHQWGMRTYSERQLNRYKLH